MASEIDLAGRRFRSIELTGSSCLIVAAPPSDDGSFMLFRWSARAGDAPQPVAGVDLHDLRPEALFAIPGGARRSAIRAAPALLRPAGDQHGVVEIEQYTRLVGSVCGPVREVGTRQVLGSHGTQPQCADVAAPG